MDQKSSWRTRTYYRISIAAMLCLTALALGTVNFLDITAAADSAPVQEAKGVAEGKASPAASAASDGLRRATGRDQSPCRTRDWQLRLCTSRGWHGARSG